MPIQRTARVTVERLKGHSAEYSYIMVAQQAGQHWNIAQFLYTGIWVWAVANHIAQAPGFVNLPGVFQHGFEGGVIGVNV